MADGSGGLNMPSSLESELLPSIQHLLKSHFLELRGHLTSELDALRRALQGHGPLELPLVSRRGSREEKSQEFSGDFSRQTSEDQAASRSVLRSHRGFLSQKLLHELGEEDEPKRPGPLFGEDPFIRATPLRALLGGAQVSKGSRLPSSERSDDRGSAGPAPPEVPVMEVKVQREPSGASSEFLEPAIAPPTEPAPAMAALTALGSSDEGRMLSSSPCASVGGSRRRGSSMTEKAFGLHRTGSVTSLDLDRSYWIRVQLLRLVQNVWFESISMIMLCANAVIIGVQTDWMAVNRLSHVPWALRAFDLWFCFFFSLELLLRILAHGRRFFSMNGCAWNMMDLILVSAYVAETILLVVADVDTEADGNSGRVAGTNPEIMRVIRILRAIKVVRLVGAVRFTQDLQLLINCLFRSLKQFLWSALLLLLAIYVVAIYITQAATAYRLENENGKEVDLMVRWWGSMPKSILSLFEGVTGGVDWHQIADPLIDGISPWFGLLFIVFMAFCILALLNVITGWLMVIITAYRTFVETMSQQAKELQLRNRIFQARRLFKEIDIDGSGFISPDEILGQTSTPAVQEFFETIDVDPSDAKGLLEVIDIDGNGKINFEEFLEGSLRLNGSAKSSDLIMLAREMKRFQATQLKELAAIKASLQ